MSDSVTKGAESIQEMPSSNKVLQFYSERTPFFVCNEGRLEQVVFLHVELGERISKAEVRISSNNTNRVQNVGRLGKGMNTLEIYVPEVDCPTDFRMVLAWNSNEIGTSVKVLPEKHWIVHVIQHSHLDIGYTDVQEDVLDFQLTYLDQVLELCDLTENDQPDSQFKWVIEVTWPLKYWMKSRPKKQVEKMIQRIKEGRIEVAACYMNMHTEAYSIDELARTFETTQKLRDEYGIHVDTAIQSDVPGHTFGFLKCLTDLKIKYFSTAHNYAGRSIPHLLPGEKLQRPFYWKDENEGKVLVWYTDTPHGVYMEGNRLGLADGFAEATKKMPALFEKLREEKYPFDILHLRVQGAYWDNAGPSLIPSQVVQEWNQKWVYPKLMISTNRAFFQHVESMDSKIIPTFTGDWTDWWADGIGSAAFENGINRKTHHILRSAETFHALAVMKDINQSYPKSTLQNAYENMVLFDEHTWGAANPWDKTQTDNTSGQIQWNIKRGFAYNAHYEAAREYKKAQNLLVETLNTKDVGDSSTVVVFNPGSQVRTDLVKVFIPLGKLDVRNPVQLIDPMTNEEVPFVSKLGPESAPRPRGGYIYFVAKNIPAFGYRTYYLRPIQDTAQLSEGTLAIETHPYILENLFYKITFDTESGAILSIIDKEMDREIVNQNSPFQFNQYIYDRYTTAPRFNHLSSRITGTADQLLGKRSSVRLAKVQKGEFNEVYQTTKISIQAPGCEWIEQEIILYHEIKRIDIVNRLMKTATEEKEAVYFSYPFDVPDGKVRYEITGGYVSPDDHHVPGSCHYMKAIQHWLAVSNSDFTVLWGTLEAPLIELGNIYVPYTPFERTLPKDEKQTVYSYALNNIWDTNFPNEQGGELVFHYSLTSHSNDFDPILTYQFGSQVQNPLSGLVVPQEVSTMSDTWVSVDAENVQVIGIRMIDECRFLVLMQEIAGKRTDTTLSFTGVTITRAFTSNFAGGNLSPIEIYDEKILIQLNKNSLKAIVVETSIMRLKQQ